MGRTARLISLVGAASFLLPIPARAATAVALERSRFEPPQVNVPVGETVVWTNNDAARHSVTADDGSFDSHPSCGSVGGACMLKGETFQVTFSKPGAVAYYCRVHGGPAGRGMAGTVTVS
jgi:plastocyanin